MIEKTCTHCGRVRNSPLHPSYCAANWEGKPKRCGCCDELITQSSNPRHSCGFYWMGDQVADGEFLNGRPVRCHTEWIPEEEKGKDLCQGWGCNECMIETKDGWFHKPCLEAYRKTERRPKLINNWKQG